MSSTLPVNPVSPPRFLWCNTRKISQIDRLDREWCACILLRDMLDRLIYINLFVILLEILRNRGEISLVTFKYLFLGKYKGCRFQTWGGGSS